MRPRATIRLGLPAMLAGWLVFGLSGLVYGLTLSPTINSFDSAELITGAYSLGIVHAPGYPLYMLLAHLATRVPWGDIPLNVNLLSGLFSALATTVVFYASWRLSGSLWCSVVAALLLAFSRLFWSQAVIAEVYALNALLISGVILTAILWHDRPSRKTLLALALVVGLSLTHHPSAMLLGPGILVLVALRNREADLAGRDWLAALAALMAPLLLYAYLPIRFMAEPPLNYVGDYFDVDLTSVQGLLWMVSGRMFAEEVFGRPLAEGLRQVTLLGWELWLNLVGGGLVLALYGLWNMERRSSLAIFLGGSAVLIVAFFGFYDVVDNALMIHPVLVLLAPGLAVGLERFVRKILQRSVLHSAMSPGLLGGVAMVWVALVIAANWGFADRSGDHSAYTFAKQVMAEVEPNALILAQWTSATPLEYLQLVEDRRPDVEILDRGLLGLAVRDQLMRRGMAASGEYGAFAVAVLTERVAEELKNRPVYIMEDDPVFRDSFCFERLEQDIYRLWYWDDSGRNCLG